MTVVALAEEVPLTAPARGATRAVRTVVLGGLSLLLAATAHLVGGGRLPSAGVLFVTAGVLGLVAVTVTTRRCRFGLLLALLTGQQLVLHLLFAAATTSCSTSMASMGHAMPAGHARLVCSAAPAASSMAAMTWPAWAMWAAHLAATGLTAWLLARGEAWLWRVADRIAAACRQPEGLRTHRTLPRHTRRLPAIAPQHTCCAAEPRAPPLTAVIS